MRLLDSSTLQLVSKREGDIPPYAILSHTWGGDDDEVTLQEIQELSASRIGQQPNEPFEHRVTQKLGFAKIRDSAQLAQSQGYDFIWIDTCCIDKTSSAELSEAINSMFRWYRDAAICYTFLNDVGDAGAEGHNFKQSMRNSRWFTRGWTLQELIAPANVCFYSQNWTVLGDKLGSHPDPPQLDDGGFPKLISSITGIDLGVLNGSLILDELSVANKMKWAATRQTTRSEDTAYCLMGIFNVNMPLLYGEGQRAFMRLQEEILRVTDDQSIFAWSCPENDTLRYQLSGLLAPSPIYFSSFGDIKPLPPNPSRSSAPSTMTNAGLHVKLFLSSVATTQGNMEPAASQQTKHSTNEYYAVLDCYPRTIHKAGGREYQNPALRLVDLGGDQYARLNAHKVFFVPSSEMNFRGEESGSKYVYIKQHPSYGLPDIVVSHQEGHPGTFGLVDVYPHQRWNGQTRTLKPKVSNYNSVLGVFRYLIYQDRGETVYIDVYVGIFPEQRGTLSWRCWCFQKLVECGRDVPKVDAVALGNYDKIRALRLSEQHAHEGIVATVKTVRLRNDTYISLRFTKIHELDPDREIRPLSKKETPVYELDAEESARWPALVNLAGDPTVEDSWRSNLGLLDDPIGQLVTTRIRVLPRDNDPYPRKSMEESFGRFVQRAVKSKLKIESRDEAEEDVVQNYFSLRLVRACIDNDADAAKQLLDSPLSSASIEARTCIASDSLESWHNIFRGFRPLHWASVLGHVNVVKLLTERDADPTGVTNIGLSPLHLAILSGNFEVLGAFLDKVTPLTTMLFNVYDRVEQLGHLAASYVRSDKVNGIFDKLVFLDGSARTYGREPWAVSGTDIENNHGDDPENNPDTKADRTGSQLALNKFRETPLHRAAAMNNICAARYIMTRVKDDQLHCADAFRRTPLWHAAAAGAVEIVRLFLKHGANVDAQDDVGRTPLHAACRLGYEDVVEELIKAGADVNTVSQNPGFSACHFATLGGHTSILRSLLKHGARPDYDVNGRDYRSALEPIHIAVSNGFLECVKVLVEAGCDIKRLCNYRIVVNTPNPSGVIVTRLGRTTPTNLAILGSHNTVFGLLYFSSPESLEYPESSDPE